MTKQESDISMILADMMFADRSCNTLGESADNMKKAVDRIISLFKAIPEADGWITEKF